MGWVEARMCDRVARRGLAKLGGSKSADRVWVRLKGENVRSRCAAAKRRSRLISAIARLVGTDASASPRGNSAVTNQPSRHRQTPSAADT